MLIMIVVCLFAIFSLIDAGNWNNVHCISCNNHKIFYLHLAMNLDIDSDIALDSDLDIELHVIKKLKQ